MKRQRKYKGFKLNHNGSLSKFNNQQSGNQAFVRKIATITDVIKWISLTAYGLHLSDESICQLKLVLSKGIPKVLAGGGKCLCLVGEKCEFHVNLHWFRAGASPKTALQNITYNTRCDGGAA